MASSSPADCGAGGCGPGPGNVPPCEGSYSSSLGVTLQGVVDMGRKVVHDLGFRRERVFLVWQKQDATTRRWEEHTRIELMPVKVEGLTDVAKYVGEGGLASDGEITVSEVSPAQVSIRTLMGEIQGDDWPDRSDREFFFEIQLFQRCAGDDPEHRLRFTMASAVEPKTFGYEFKLIAQHARRKPNGKDAGLKNLLSRRDVKIST